MIKLDPKLLRLMAIMQSAVLLKLVLIYCGYVLGQQLDILLGTGSLMMILGIVSGAMVGIGFIVFWIYIIVSRGK